MKNKVLILGSGAREQCLAWKLSKSPLVESVVVFPGNGGDNFIASKKVSIPNCYYCNESDFNLLADWCLLQAVTLVVVGPEVPLVNGIVDTLEKRGVPCFGPRSSAAIIEGSKLFAKDFMARHSVPTARYQCFSDTESACNFVRSSEFPATVVKACGLAAGKGVIVADNQDEACYAIIQILQEKKFGDAGSQILVEEELKGEEISVLCFSDGKHIAVMPPAQDHKRLLDSDLGPNTGGMGAYCPCPQVSDETLAFIKEEILSKVITGLHAEGRPYVGVLYAGLMLTKDGPKVLEFNCRFGDPECQVILPLLNGDLFEIMQSCISQKLDSVSVTWEQNKSVVGVVLASGGYPGPYEKNKKITGAFQAKNNALLFHAGTKLTESGDLVTSGGRVLTIVGTGGCLAAARDVARNHVELVKFKGSYHRKDIAARGIAYESRSRMTYESSGVSISSGNEFVRTISPLSKLTVRSGCLSSIGGFGGLFDPAMTGYNHPVLVAGTDGVGTKLMIATACSAHCSIGVDLVAMCVNDILTHNAEPLFFLDYFACGRLSPSVARDVVKGVADGCLAAGCALIGGETAEMPGMYRDSSYDLAGFAVGAYEKGRDRSLPRLNEIIEGDVILGVASTGLHSNGFSLVRKIVEKSRLTFNDRSPFDSKRTLGESLLTPTAIYCKLLSVLRSCDAIRSVAHITGGGLLENLPRALPPHFMARLDASCWTVPPVFGWLHDVGDLEEDEMLRTFNCGLGLCVVVAADFADDVIQQSRSLIDLDVRTVGHVTTRDGGKSVVVKNMKVGLKRSYVKECTKSLDSKVVGPDRKRVAVIISGNGSNLQALIDRSLSSESPYDVKLVISNKADAYGLVRSQKHGIKSKVINSKSFANRESFDRSIHEVLIRHRIDFVCLAGFMRILSGWFVKEWRGKVINTHPSLLPLFKGLHPHKQALDAGVRVSGCSVHFVVEEMDAGPLIGQMSVPVHPEDSVDSLQERIKVAEHVLYPQSLCQVCEGKLLLSNVENKCVWK